VVSAAGRLHGLSLRAVLGDMGKMDMFLMFDRTRDEHEGLLEVRHVLPYSDLVDIDDGARRKKVDAKLALEFGHTLTQQLGGQVRAGFAITGFYEDHWSDAATNLNRYTPVYIVTRATRP